MSQEKRSFLEKLTGARTMEDEQHIEQPQAQAHQAPVYGQEEVHHMPTMVQEQPEQPIFQDDPWSNPPQQSAPKPAQEETLPQDQSLSDEQDAEGQLTIDVYQTPEEIVVKSTIAGVKPEDLDVSINSDLVTIKGERKSEEHVSSDNYFYQECYWGSFSRSVVLPVDVVADKSEASLKNGILTIRLPKQEVHTAKKIQVRGF